MRPGRGPGSLEGRPGWSWIVRFCPVLFAACQCGFQSGKLDRLACAEQSECAPDQDCDGGLCVQRRCSDAADCGVGYWFVCDDDGFCVAQRCSSNDQCEDGFECNSDDWCREAGGSPCETDDDCDDRLFCNGIERCDDGTCITKDVPDCSEADVGPCQLARCDEEADRCVSSGRGCDDLLACTTDECDGADCTNSLLEDFCLIDGSCQPEGPDPSNPCRFCDPATDDKAWSEWGGACDDDDQCTFDDACIAGSCRGTRYDCDDGRDCTIDGCDGTGECTKELVDGFCAIDAGCFAAGESAPLNPCLSCDPAADPAAWTLLTDLSCDDGDACTRGDDCRSGRCLGAEYSCDDGLGCTAEECDGQGGCIISLAADHCLIDGDCRADGETNPANPCRLCDPGQSTSGWTADDTLVPEDSLDCTADSCVGGVENHVPQDDLCPEGQRCAPCAGGCATFGAVSVSCPDGTFAPGGQGATCTIETGTAGQAGCLRCGTVLGMTSLVRETFEGCPTLASIGWDVIGDLPACPPIQAKLGPNPWVEEDHLGFRQVDPGTAITTFTRYVDTTGFDSVRVCFDYAETGMGADDFVSLRVGSDGGFEEVWADSSGPLPGVDMTWVTTCVDLTAEVPAAADNPDLGIRFHLEVDGLNSIIYLDNIAVDAWDGAHVSYPGAVTVDHFEGCDLGGWIPGVVEPTCPISGGMNDGRWALEADNARWSIAQLFDLSDRCDDIRVGFAHGNRNLTPPPDEDDLTTLTYDRGGGAELIWGAIVRTGIPDGPFQPFEVIVSHLDPDVRFQPSVTLTFLLDATGVDNNLYLDDFYIDGATCEDGSDVLAVGAPADVGGGRYEATVSSGTQATGYLECEWRGHPGTRGRDQVIFQN